MKVKCSRRMQTVPAVTVHWQCILQLKLKIYGGSSYFSFISLKILLNYPYFDTCNSSVRERMKTDFSSGFLGACLAVKKLPGFFAFSRIFSECLGKRKCQFPSLHFILQKKTKRMCRSGYRGRCQLVHAGKISRQDKAGKCRLVYERWTIRTVIIPLKSLVTNHPLTIYQPPQTIKKKIYLAI